MYVRVYILWNACIYKNKKWECQDSKPNCKFSKHNDQLNVMFNYVTRVHVLVYIHVYVFAALCVYICMNVCLIYTQSRVHVRPNILKQSRLCRDYYIVFCIPPLYFPFPKTLASKNIISLLQHHVVSLFYQISVNKFHSLTVNAIVCLYRKR